MKRGSFLSPNGTAAEKFGRLSGARTKREPLGAFFRRIANGARGHDLGDGSLYLAEELVRLQWSLGQDERKALALIVLASIIGLRQGSTRLPLSSHPDSYLGRIVTSIIKTASPAAGGAAAEKPKKLLKMITSLPTMVTFDRLIGSPSDHRPLILHDNCVYQQAMFHAEQRTIAQLRRRIDDRAQDTGVGDEALTDVCARPAYKGDAAMNLSEEQRAAVKRALFAPLTVITGGPGTGKTAIVAAILRSLTRLGISHADIALAAPTGKAVARIATSLGDSLASVREPSEVDEQLAGALPEAQTIHRMLGYIPHRDQFRHHENNPVDAAIVIIDEASMIDLTLMERLLRALRPTTRLVLLGDADQLPSVDAGAVLRDLVDVTDAVRLTHSYRMDPSDPRGRSILTVATEINSGRIETLTKPASEGARLLDTKSNLGKVEAFVDDWYNTRVAGHDDFNRLIGKTYRATAGTFGEEDRADMAALFHHYDRSRLLCVTRRYATGAEAINRMLHRRIVAGTDVNHKAEFCPGEPILMRRNDYERGLFNGDPGLILRVSEDGAAQRYRAVFPRSRAGQVDYLVFPLDALRTHVDIAFAITVHQSQGSEFDEVGLLLPTTDLPLLTREMLYTGITRARHNVTIVGSTPLLRIAANRTAERFSGITTALR